MLRALAILISLASPTVALAETYLLMAERVGCYWCQRWDEEIAPIYSKTPEGQAAPLKRYDVQRDKPDVAFNRAVRYTPTFILVRDGQELDRIEGYPGEDFFWGLLGAMFERSDANIEQAG